MSCGTEIPEREPEILVNKTNWKWSRNITGFSPDDYDFIYYLVQQQENPHKIELTANANGDMFLIDYDSSTPEVNLSPEQIGNYTWQAFLIEKADPNNKQFFATGVFNIIQNAQVEISDPRTFFEKMRDSIKAFIEGRANIQDKKKTINDRSLETYSIAELQEWLNFYEEKIESEQRENEACSGKVNKIHKIRTTYEGFH